MLVIHLINGMGIGGGEQLLADLVRGMGGGLDGDIGGDIDGDIESVVYCLTRVGCVGDSLQADGIKVHRLTQKGVPQWLDWSRFFSDLRRAQVIHTHFFYSDLVGSVLGRLFGVPRRISTRHDMGYWMRSAHLALEPWVYRGFHQVLCVSRAVADSMRMRGAPADRLVFLPPGVGRCSKVSGVPEQRHPCVVAVGRLEWVKGHDGLLRAFASFVEDERFAQWRLTIVGAGSQQQRLQQLARDLGLDGICRFAGELGRQEVWSLLDSASLFVLPSHSEAMPLSLIEAMKCGVPSIASAVGGVPELITHDHNGWLVDAGHSEELAQAMATLAGDPVRAHAMGEAGRQSVEGRFDMQQYVRGVLESYGDDRENL